MKMSEILHVPAHEPGSRPARRRALRDLRKGDRAREVAAKLDAVDALKAERGVQA